VRRIAAVGACALVAILGLVAVSPVAADVVRHFLAQSDFDPAPGGEVLPDSEWVDVGAPDLADYVDSIYPDYLVLAPGQTREQIVDDVTARWSGMSGVTQEVGFRRDMEIAVFCGWAKEWREAREIDDDGRAQAAVDGMLLTTTWPALAATDGGGVVDRQVEIINAGTSGDRDDFEFGVSQNGCSTYPESVGE
jgi:hypothetical protein